ncbi:uncharacterized protein LOC122856037 [Aphidius gifuensis]|uniref:uncharacterized protein LOC122856037 n=1 Tax=Aphidius gifuensis TaxID=684658 RepID=UPI001CDCE1A3|nr:uncharacterized protein LOC122856037 [Aphidius gifuensis]
MGRRRSAIAQGSTSAPIDDVVDESLGLSRITRKDGIASVQLNNTKIKVLTLCALKRNISEYKRKSKQMKNNTKNGVLSESDKQKLSSIITQRPTPAPIDEIVIDREAERLESRRLLELTKKTKMTVDDIKTRNIPNDIDKEIYSKISAIMSYRLKLKKTGTPPPPIDNCKGDIEDQNNEQQNNNNEVMKGYEKNVSILSLIH